MEQTTQTEFPSDITTYPEPATSDRPSYSSRFWNFGNLRMSKEMIQYIIQMGMLTTTMIFSLVNLASGSLNHTLYVSLLSTIIGVIIPNPKVDK